MKKILSLLVVLGLAVLLLISFLLILPTQAAPAAANANGSGSKPEQVGAPWFDEAWLYRQRLIITNSAASLPYYQILIKLDSNNFDFTHARVGGEDIRFTHSDGTTELAYWCESWDYANRLAYLWVRVPSLPNGVTVIYMYYGNPAAVTVSSGNATFDGFDDGWSQYTSGALPLEATELPVRLNGEILSPFNWSIISGNPTATAGILSLTDGSGIKTRSSYLYQAIGMRANFGINSTDEWIGFSNGTNGPRTRIGDNKPGNLNDLLLINSVNGVDFEYVVLPKLGGQNWHGYYHIFELHWNVGQTMADIDHGISSAVSSTPGRVPGSLLPVSLYNDAIVNSSLLVDWIYVRQYREPEPTTVVGPEQGLVELTIGTTDSPDPVRKGVPTTYRLTITNTASIDAPGIMVTDTLPANVDLVSVEASKGSCEPGNIVLCNLGKIASGSHAWVSVEVNANLDGVITNTATVGSPGYELDLSDNSSDESTLVDWTPPETNWEKPVKNGETFLSTANVITLAASATDGGGIARVEFLLWDHKVNQWVTIGSVDNYPYQVNFDTHILAVNDPYQVFVKAIDKAGNSSNPYNPLQRIFIERWIAVFIPVLKK